MDSYLAFHTFCNFGNFGLTESAPVARTNTSAYWQYNWLIHILYYTPTAAILYTFFNYQHCSSIKPHYQITLCLWSKKQNFIQYFRKVLSAYSKIENLVQSNFACQSKLPDISNLKFCIATSKHFNLIGNQCKFIDRISLTIFTSTKLGSF